MHEGDDGFEAIGRRLRELRHQDGRSQEALAKRLGVDRSEVVRAELGQRLSPRIAALYDDFYNTGGVISARRRTVVEARKRKRVSPSHRRRFLHVAGTPAVAAALDRADKVYQSLAASAPDPWTLDELAVDAVAIAARYWSTPLDQLLLEVLDRWNQLANMLDRGPVGPAGQRVVELAGMYAYYIAKIGHHTGDRLLAAKFGRIAARCAEISGDPLLVGTVACLRSTAACDHAQYDEAADIAARAVRQAHPFTRARLCAYQAEALAGGGHGSEAHAALADMRIHMVDLPPMSGAGVFDEGEQLGFSAMVLVELGDDREAEVLARERLAGAPDDDYQAQALDWLTIGKALASSEPGAAADAGLRALEANGAWPEVSVETRARQLHRTLTREHGSVVEVVRLGEAVAALRPAVAI